MLRCKHPIVPESPACIFAFNLQRLLAFEIYLSGFSHLLGLGLGNLGALMEQHGSHAAEYTDVAFQLQLEIVLLLVLGKEGKFLLAQHLTLGVEVQD